MVTNYQINYYFVYFFYILSIITRLLIRIKIDLVKAFYLYDEYYHYHKPIFIIFTFCLCFVLLLVNRYSLVYIYRYIMYAKSDSL